MYVCVRVCVCVCLRVRVCVCVCVRVCVCVDGWPLLLPSTARRASPVAPATSKKGTSRADTHKCEITTILLYNHNRSSIIENTSLDVPIRNVKRLRRVHSRRGRG
eukprot:GHVU01107503.1.p1 GENE.GHVU01107503.1~~GHVU01107503.1.p1  ORF type:complete len:105 (+),score=4.62 GHVU01107503.1:118-432(+)